MDKIASPNKIQNDGPSAALNSTVCVTDCCGSATSPVVANKFLSAPNS